jgi:predicted RNA-binding Zn-ribbon protein involved in translation (DUF1610 family)
MKCPGCGVELKPDERTCPYCGKPIIAASTGRQFSQRREYSGVRHQQGRVVTDDDVDEETTIRTEEHERLKPGSSVDIRRVGTRMGGTHYVDSVRHRIASDETEGEIRCVNCRAMNDKKSKFCRNCGTRLPS